MPRAPQPEIEELDDELPRAASSRVVAFRKKELGNEDGSFLRAKQRPAVRKAGIRVRASRALFWCSAALALGTLIVAGAAARRYALHAKRFVVRSSESVETQSMKNVSRAQVVDVFGADLGRNIFFIPLELRRKQLQSIPWIRTATVMRLLPDRIRVSVTERTPIAFAQVGASTALIDAEGTLMALPRTHDKYDFPLITGFSASEPADVRAARIRIYEQVVQALDADNAHYSKDLSEVDLNDPRDVRIVTSDDAGPVLVHLGDEQFQQRYRFYLEHIAAWRQQYQVGSVDLRYDGQVIVNREGQGSGR